jgi:hypothetical protein
MPGPTESGRLIGAALLALLVCAPPLSAQPLVLEEGARLRVTMEGARRSVVATLVETRRDTLVLGRHTSPVPSTMPLAVPQIRKLEISVGDRSLAPIGATVGVVVGAIVVASYNRIRAGQCFRECPDSFPGVIGAGIGGVVGGVSLAFVRVDRWREISLPGRR